VIDLEGAWAVESTVPGGGRYRGTITARRVGDTVEMEWDITAGRYVGVGLPLEDTWYVACGEDWDSLGLALIAADGAIDWTPAPDRGSVRTTELASPSGRPGPWRAGPATDPAFPFAEIRLEERGELLGAFLTTEGGRSSTGLALRSAKGFAVAWYRRPDQVVILRYTAGEAPDTLEGVWGLGSHPDPAAETLHRVA
jgi:hypothetical protein